MVMCISLLSCVCIWEFIFYLKFLPSWNSSMISNFLPRPKASNTNFWASTIYTCYSLLHWALSKSGDPGEDFVIYPLIKYKHTLHKIKCQILILRFAHPYHHTLTTIHFFSCSKEMRERFLEIKFEQKSNKTLRAKFERVWEGVSEMRVECESSTFTPRPLFKERMAGHNN